jgi:hypothetical protein
MESRSYARIEWVDSQLGLRMVNRQQQSFYLYAESFLMLFRKPYVLVKYADRHPEQCIRRHGGEIWAALNSSTTGVSLIRLFFIMIGRRILVSPDKQMQDVIALQDYELPTEELDSFKQAIEAMHLQWAEYNLMKMDADTSPL